MSGFSGASGVPKKYVDDLVAQSTAKTRLWNGPTVPNSGISYNLSDSIVNYEYILIRCMTNTNNMSQIYISAMLLESNKYALFSAFDNRTTGLVTDFSYKSYCNIQFASDGNSFTVNGAWTNENWIIKPMEIWGIKPV